MGAHPKSGPVIEVIPVVACQAGLLGAALQLHARMLPLPAPADEEEGQRCYQNGCHCPADDCNAFPQSVVLDLLGWTHDEMQPSNAQSKHLDAD